MPPGRTEPFDADSRRSPPCGQALPSRAADRGGVGNSPVTPTADSPAPTPGALQYPPPGARHAPTACLVSTAIGPAGPRGPEDTTPLAGWEATVGTEGPSSGSVGYTGRRTYGDPVPQASSTAVPADAPRSWEQILADFASGLGTMRPVQVKPIEAPKFTQMAPFTPLGRGVETFR